MIMSSNPSLTHQTIRPPTLRTQDITPWDSPIDASLLLQDLARLIARHVVLPRWGAETLALWTLHTYAFHLHLIFRRYVTKSDIEELKLRSPAPPAKPAEPQPAEPRPDGSLTPP